MAVKALDRLGQEETERGQGCPEVSVGLPAGYADEWKWCLEEMQRHQRGPGLPANHNGITNHGGLGSSRSGLAAALGVGSSW